ncbi:MAG: ATP-dependent protease ATPase subunit HslU [Clostridia bacterium]
MSEYTPSEVVKELDRYIIGQKRAKRAVAVALRNRYRRNKLSDKLREEITPKNIIMQGPTGVGKTEIARRLARLVKAPFIKVEATKFTEVGYVGRDVESMVRDLVECAVRLVKEEKASDVESRAKERVEDRILPCIVKKRKESFPEDMTPAQIKSFCLQELREGKLNDFVIDIDLPDVPKQQTLAPGNGMEINLNDLVGDMFGNKNKVKSRTIAVGAAYKELMEFEENNLIDPDSVNAEAIRRAENEGIIFIDEIDKITSSGQTNGPDVSREGVQRDILPIVEGCTVNTKYGNIKTDYILFIASGAFQIASVSDLIPELQGRFPIIVKLDSLTEQDFRQILTQPDNAILMQYTEMLAVDNVKLKFTEDAINEIASIAAQENENSEDIGARRLHTIMELLLDEVSFAAGEEDFEQDVVVDKQYVVDHLNNDLRGKNLRNFIL